MELISTEQTTAQVNVEGLNPCAISYYRIQISNNNETATSEEVELQTDPSGRAFWFPFKVLQRHLHRYNN